MSTALRTVEKRPWLPDDVNQYKNLLTGVLQGQPITLKSASDISAFLLTLQSLDATNGRVLKILKPNGDTGLQYDINGLTVSSPATFTGGLQYTGGPIYNLKAEGGDPTGSDSIDAIWTDIVADMPSTGGAIYIPFGAYEADAPLTVSKPCIIYSDALYSSVLGRSATANVFNVTVGATGQVIFKHLNIGKIVDAQPSTAGYGINFTPSGGSDIAVAPLIEHCRIANQFVGINLMRAVNARLLYNAFAEQRSKAVQIDYDVSPFGAGDHYLIGNTLSNSYIGTTIGVDILGGAGITLLSNKFIGFQVQASLNIQSGRLNCTDFFIGGLGASMEAQPDTLSLISLQSEEAFGEIQIGYGLQGVVGNGAASAINIPSMAGAVTDVKIMGAMLRSSTSGDTLISVNDAAAEIDVAGNNFSVGTGVQVFNVAAGTVRQSMPNNVRGAGTLGTPAFTTANRKSQFGSTGSKTTNGADGTHGFTTDAFSITYGESFYAQPQIEFKPTSTACWGGRVLSHTTSGGKYTGASVELIGSTDATAITADWEAKAVA